MESSPALFSARDARRPAGAKQAVWLRSLLNLCHPSRAVKNRSPPGKPSSVELRVYAAIFRFLHTSMTTRFRVVPLRLLALSFPFFLAMCYWVELCRV